MATVEKAMVFFLTFAAVMAVSMGKIYKVGDSEGWTIGNVSYASWAASKTFHVGDTIVFEYNKQFHNVLQVSRDEYRSCNGTSPITTHTSGNDSITIKRKGHYFFLCGVPGHCGLGQKVDIRVVNQTLSPVSSPSSSPTASPSTPSSSLSVPAGGPGGSSMNHASSKGLSFLGLATFAVASVLLM
ncbi:hypothetical protein AAC387_Pa03g3875 [Persea americana]